MHWLFLTLGALGLIGVLVAVPSPRWTDSPGFFLLSAATFTLSGLGGFVPGLWKPLFYASALGLMTASTIIDQRRKRGSSLVARRLGANPPKLARSIREEERLSRL